MPKCAIRMQDFLSNVPLFKNLDRAQLARLAAGTTELEVLRGAAVYSRGDPCTGLYAVVYGQIKLLLQTDRGDETVVDLLESGATFGEAPLFSGKPHILAAAALADSKLLHVAKDTLIHELERDTCFCRRVIAAIGERLYRRYSEFEDYVLASGTERVIGYLLRAENTDAQREAVCITLPASKGVIASRLHLTHEHFSRILRELMTAGLIEVDGREVRIPSIKRLYGYAA